MLVIGEKLAIVQVFDTPKIYQKRVYLKKTER